MAENSKTPGILTFMDQNISRSDLDAALRVMRKFHECESGEEWHNIPFMAWSKLEQLEDFIRIMTATDMDRVADPVAIGYWNERNPGARRAEPRTESIGTKALRGLAEGGSWSVSLMETRPVARAAEAEADSYEETRRADIVGWRRSGDVTLSEALGLLLETGLERTAALSLLGELR